MGGEGQQIGVANVHGNVALVRLEQCRYSNSSVCSDTTYRGNGTDLGAATAVDHPLQESKQDIVLVVAMHHSPNHTKGFDEPLLKHTRGTKKSVSVQV
jgi:hypothetical protein